MIKKTNTSLTRTCDKVADFLTANRILRLSVLVAGMWGLYFIFFNGSLFRDVANCYAWYAREFSRGVWNSQEIAGLPPFTIFVGGLLAKTGIETFRGLVLLSVFCYVMTIVPLYYLLQGFFSKKYAALGCLLYVTAPKIIRFAGMGMLESQRELFLVLALLLLFQAWHGELALWKACVFGVILALLTLCRAEGSVMTAFIVFAYFIRLCIHKENRTHWCRGIVLPFLLTVFSLFAVLLPRLVEMWHVTGYPVVDERQIVYLKKIPGVAKIFHEKSTWKVSTDFAKVSAMISPGELALPVAEEEEEPFVKKCFDTLEKASRGGFELYLIFSAVGIVVLSRQKKWCSQYGFLLMFGFCLTGCLVFFPTAYRYFLFLVPLFLVFTLHGISFLLYSSSKQQYRPLMVGFMFLVMLLQPVNLFIFIRHQGDWQDRKSLAEFIRTNRAGFFPNEAEHDRKLMIYAYELQDVCYYCDEDKYDAYHTSYLPPQLAVDFDVLVLERREEDIVKKVMQRGDLREIPHPFQKNYLLMKHEQR